MAHLGSSGLRFGSSGVIRTQIWLIGGHQDSDLAHRLSSGLMGTQILLIAGQQGSLGLIIQYSYTHNFAIV